MGIKFEHDFRRAMEERERGPIFSLYNENQKLPLFPDYPAPSGDGIPFGNRNVEITASV
jgi:hypothetical protein